MSTSDMVMSAGVVTALGLAFNSYAYRAFFSATLQPLLMTSAFVALLGTMTWSFVASTENETSISSRGSTKGDADHSSVALAGGIIYLRLLSVFPERRQKRRRVARSAAPEAGAASF